MDQSLSQLLSRCAIDLTSRLERDELSPAFERQSEVSAALQMLAAGNRPLILGRSRSGKTTVARAIAREIGLGAVPPELQGLALYEFSPSALLASLQFGEGWRANVSALFNQLNEQQRALIFLRDLHTAVGAGVRRGDDDDDDLAATLESVLSDTKLFVVAEARADRWQTLAADRDSFASLFVSLPLPALGSDQVLSIVQHVVEQRFERSGVIVPQATQQTVLDISRRFILNQAFPGKTIELLDEALMAAQREATASLEPRHIVECFRNRTGLTPLLLDDAAPFDEATLRRAFSERVLGQEPAVAAMVQKLALLKARLHDPSRPMGVYLYLGPTGVGKTELARTLAATLFGSEDRFVRFNMADYSGPHDFMQLFGQSWGDNDTERRGKLTLALINLPFAVLLLDEFEKAHHSIFNRFLQLFDEGLLVNAMGEEVNLRNTIIIMTSNFGASIVQGETWGFTAREGMEAVERRVLRETEAFFSPEFINRLDGVTFFKPLSQSDMRRIAARELRKLFDREGLTRRNVQVELDDGVLDVLLKHGYSVRYGARYLKRQIEKMVSYPLAAALLAEPQRTDGWLRLYATRDHIKATWVNEDDEVVLSPDEAAATPDLPTTLDEATALLASLRARLALLAKGLNVPQAREQQAALLEEMSGPAFWDDPAEAQEKLAELSAVAHRIDRCDHLERLADEAVHLEQRVQNRERRLFPELVRTLGRFERDLRFAELELFFHDAEDWHDALVILEHTSGTGDGLRWVRQLANMYLSWAASKRFEAEVLEETVAEDQQARVTLRLNGTGLYGLLRHEAGTHRISEVGGEPRRKTVTQVQVSVLPVPDEDAPELPLVEVDASTSAVRANGHFLRRLRGSARAIHVPTGTAALVTAQSERAARDLALLLLQARLLAGAGGRERADAGGEWGSVVRTYHFSKRTYIKDPRTAMSTPNPRDVLAGKLDLFIEAALRELNSR